MLDLPPALVAPFEIVAPRIGDAIDAMAAAHAMALRRGCTDREAMAFALAALRDADLAPLAVAGPGVERVNRKAARQVRRTIDALLEKGREL